MGFLEELGKSSVNKKGVVKVPDHIKFNKEQQEAIEDIKRFLDSDEIYYCLKGKGGTGKTTVISGALEGCNNILGVTISHKAKERLSESIMQCNTFASACGMKVVQNEIGEQEFVLNEYAKSIPISEASFIVIDECSMISKEGVNIVHELRKPGSKVIYMGDFRQLPPIDEGGADSITFKIKNTSNLTERIRQGIGNPIIGLSDVIANEIESKNFDPFVIHDHLIDNINKEGKGYYYVDDSDFILKFVADFKKDKTTKFISFRTATVGKYNKIIRETIYKGVKDLFVKDELIIANKSYFDGDELILKNSVEYFVESYKKSHVMNFECSILKLRDVEDSIPVLTKKGRIAYNKELKHLSSKKMWKKFWQLKPIFAEVDYGYAINTHKSQGSTYKNVYIDFNDILSVSKITDKEKCQSLYVAITRASFNLHLLDI
jgi:exodeoxyribonuclease-5